MEHGLDVWVYSGNDWLVRDASAPHVEREAWTVKFRPKTVSRFRRRPAKGSQDRWRQRRSAKVERCEADAQAALGHRATAVRSQPYYLDITHPDANKGFVAGYFSRMLGIPEEEIATIGDQPNDVLMFKQSGFSIAMGNASDEVKGQASAVTDSYDDAKALPKLSSASCCGEPAAEAAR